MRFVGMTQFAAGEWIGVELVRVQRPTQSPTAKSQGVSPACRWERDPVARRTHPTARMTGTWAGCSISSTLGCARRFGRGAWSNARRGNQACAESKCRRAQVPSDAGHVCQEVAGAGRGAALWRGRGRRRGGARATGPIDARGGSGGRCGRAAAAAAAVRLPEPSRPAVAQPLALCLRRLVRRAPDCRVAPWCPRRPRRRVATLSRGVRPTAEGEKAPPRRPRRGVATLSGGVRPTAEGEKAPPRSARMARLSWPLALAAHLSLRRAWQLRDQARMWGSAILGGRFACFCCCAPACDDHILPN